MGGIINIKTGLPFAPSWPRVRSHHASPYITLGESEPYGEAASPQTLQRARGLVLGARGIACGGAKSYSAKSYVQDGLISQFDGVENVAYNTHSDTATTWTDLKGLRTCTLYGGATFNDIALVVTTVNTDYATLSSGNYVYKTLEAVFSIDSGWTYDTAWRWGFGVLCWGPNYSGYGLVHSASNYITDDDSSSNRSNIAFKLPSYKQLMSVAVVKDDSTYANRTTAMYHNGELATSTSSDDVVSAGGYALGGYSIKRGCASKFCSIRAYSRVLTDAEREANYEVDKARFGLT